MRWLVCYQTGRVVSKSCVLGALSSILDTAQRCVVADAEVGQGALSSSLGGDLVAGVVRVDV